ncbi:MAG: hypothetical protein QOF55_902, partial [Thermoleophilaceae bacterium]|nr:hypothetical protein [Thermoleophilaceae bacterium]
MPRRSVPLLLFALLALAVPASAGAADKTTWLCQPGQKSDPCRQSLTATILKSDGSSTTEHRKIDRNAPIDCFYVYPTVSDQKTANSNLHIDPEERAVSHYQASRFSQHCRVWAPMYRSLTLAAVFGGPIAPAAAAKAYAGVRSAWREYLARHNHGRGVVLLAHSQGAFLLRQLIKDEIDRKPAVRRRIVSAILLGGNVTVRKGSDRGGDFKNIGACRSPTQTGCVVAYSSYGDTPPSTSMFGRVPAASANRLQVLCTNPAALGGGTATLQPYTATTPFPGT